MSERPAEDASRNYSLRVPETKPSGAETRESSSRSPRANADVSSPPEAEETHADSRGDAEVSHSKRGAATLTLGALGVVFGDIGTSPLYALNAVFATEGVPPNTVGVYGVISLVFWAVTLVVSLKYVAFVMRAEHEGEGGIVTLLGLVEGARRKRAGAGVVIALGLFGAALFYGDGMITPAISVLSAVEGLEVAAPGLEDFVIPITLAILIALFA